MIRRALLLGGVTLALAFALFWATLPDVPRWPPPCPGRPRSWSGARRSSPGEGERTRLDWTPVPLSRIAPDARPRGRRGGRLALLGARGRRLGSDPGGGREELGEGRDRVGASTITQQLAKNLYLSPARTPWRKLREWAISRRLEKTLSKKRILELYLNLIEFGRRTYGAEAAARRYFGKSARRSLAIRGRDTGRRHSLAPDLRPGQASRPRVRAGGPPGGRPWRVDGRQVYYPNLRRNDRHAKPRRSRPLWRRLRAARPAAASPPRFEISPKKVKIYGLERAQRLVAQVLDKKGQPLGGPTAELDVFGPGRRGGSGRGRARRLQEGGQGHRHGDAAKGLSAPVTVEVVDVKRHRSHGAPRAASSGRPEPPFP